MLVNSCVMSDNIFKNQYQFYVKKPYNVQYMIILLVKMININIINI